MEGAITTTGRLKFGADGWSYAEVLPYFLRTEQQNAVTRPVPLPRPRRPDEASHWPRRPNQLNRDFIAATQSLGFPGTGRYFTGPTNEGVGFRQGVLRGPARD